MNQEKPNQQKREIRIKINDEEIRGVYANWMKVTHSREEFVMDFANIVPPTGIITSRIITTPGHLKRIIAALEENLKLYEKKFGDVTVAEVPEQKREIGFKT